MLSAIGRHLSRRERLYCMYGLIMIITLSRSHGGAFQASTFSKRRNHAQNKNEQFLFIFFFLFFLVAFFYLLFSKKNPNWAICIRYNFHKYTLIVSFGNKVGVNLFLQQAVQQSPCDKLEIVLSSTFPAVYFPLSHFPLQSHSPAALSRLDCSDL